MDRVRVFDDKDALGVGVAEWIAELAAKAVASHGAFRVAFSGGSLPAIVAAGIKTESLKAKCRAYKWQVRSLGSRPATPRHRAINRVASGRAV